MRIAPFFAAIERLGAKWARRQPLAALTCALLVLLVRAAELPRLPVPEPWIHDEFSFLLAAGPSPPPAPCCPCWCAPPTCRACQSRSLGSTTSFRSSSPPTPSPPAA